MIDILHRVGIKAPPAKVYAALATIEGVAGWWTKETSGASRPGGTIDFQFSSPGGERIGGMSMEVLALDPDKAVRWRCKAGPESTAAPSGRRSCSASRSSSKPGRAGPRPRT